MIYRLFGRTGLQMPVLSAGGMRCMQSWQDMPLQEIAAASQHNVCAILEQAVGHGITHIETARGYGSSERQLGAALQLFDREELIIQTKVGPRDDPDLFAAEVRESLDRLQLDRVDLLAIHGINDYRGLWQACRPHGCLAKARQLQRQGLIGWIGFSTHGPTDVLLNAVKHEDDGGFDYINLHWYAIFQRHAKVIEEAADREMGIFIISPSDKGGMLYNPPQDLRQLCQPLTPMQFNDLYCLQHAGVTTISIGAATPQDYLEHVNALQYLENRQLVQEIHGRWQDRMESRTGFRFPDAVFDLFPSFENTPGYINIPFVLWLDNLARGWDLKQYARERYQKLGREMPWVAGNHGGHAKAADFQEIAEKAGWSAAELIERLRAAHRLLGND